MQSDEDEEEWAAPPCASDSDDEEEEVVVCGLLDSDSGEEDQEEPVGAAAGGKGANNPQAADTGTEYDGSKEDPAEVGGKVKPHFEEDAEGDGPGEQEEQAPALDVEDFDEDVMIARFMAKKAAGK
jgi:hypothetical protein